MYNIIIFFLILQKGWVIRSKSVGNKAGLRLQLEEMKREIVSGILRERERERERGGGLSSMCRPVKLK